MTIASCIWTAMGCGGAPRVILLSAQGAPATSVAALLEANPLPRGENIRAVTLGRSDALSYHFVQIRDRERPHVHVAHDLVVTLLRGTGAMHSGGEVTQMHAGDVVVIPRSTVHYFVNRNCRPAAALVTFAPPFDGTDQVPAE